MAEVNEGDWVEGAPKWWWKYVFPTPETLWLAVLNRVEPGPIPWLQRVTGEVLNRVEPVPQPWLQSVTGEILEGLAMLHAAARADQATSLKLKSEAVAKISQAVGGIQQG
jgi:hypothetical protein